MTPEARQRLRTLAIVYSLRTWPKLSEEQRRILVEAKCVEDVRVELPYKNSPVEALRLTDAGLAVRHLLDEQDKLMRAAVVVADGMTSRLEPSPEEDRAICRVYDFRDAAKVDL